MDSDVKLADFLGYGYYHRLIRYALNSLHATYVTFTHLIAGQTIEHINKEIQLENTLLHFNQLFRFHKLYCLPDRMD